jgi:hypothetical protein
MIFAVIASAAKQSMLPKWIDGLLRRCAPLRKRFAFVAGNDGRENTRLIDVDASAIIEL